MKTVFQKGNYDCGVACVAMLCRFAYSRASKLCADIYKEDYGIDATPMKVLLQQLGFTVISNRRPGPKHLVSDLQNDAILQCKLLPAKGVIKPDNTWGHWVVWDAKQRVVRDPSGYQKAFWITSYMELMR